MLNTSRFGRYVSAVADLRLRPYARVAVTSGAAIVLVLGALLAFDMPESLANGGLFEELFGSPHRQRVVEPLYYAPREHGWRISRRRHGRHYAHHVGYARHARRHFPVGAHQLATAHPAPAQTVALGRRSVCVRTCDGYYFPISYSTSPSRFADDQHACQRECPAAEAVLYTYRNPGEDIGQAMSIAGQPYSELPNAFHYRKEFSAACSCRRPGQSWADALKGADDSSTLESGDIVVTDQNAKALSQPPQPKSANGKPIKPGTKLQNGTVTMVTSTLTPGSHSLTAV